MTPLTLGVGLEFETNSEQTEWGFPLLIQYNFTEFLQLSIEPSFGQITGKTPGVRTVGGLGDLEMSIEWEFWHERRWTPSLGIESTLRFPTASHRDLGNRNYDYSVGFVLSKDLVFFDLSSNVTYTFSGDRDQASKLEVSLVAEYPVNYRFGLFAEYVQAVEYGPASSGAPSEGTLGFTWHVTRFVSIEYGTQLRSDGSWQELLGFEYSFGGND